MCFIDYSDPYLLSREHFCVVTCLRSVLGAPGRAQNCLKLAKIGKNCHFFHVCMLITGFLDIPHGFIDYSGPYLLSRGNFGILTCFRMVPGPLGGPKIASK